MSNVNKLVVDGQVAVLYSPGFGAGWSTWNSEHAQTLIFDAEIAQAVLDGDHKKAIEIAEIKCPGVYVGGGEQLRVEWVTRGDQFQIDEYDGNESVHVIGEQIYFCA